MLLPFWDGLVKTTECDPEMAALADRHYSRQTPGSPRFMGNGRKLVLRDGAATILFGWLWPLDGLRRDGQIGYNCTIFRNESDRRSSDIIREAEAAAFAYWGPNRCYTYIDASKVQSRNPGYCFLCAGWKRAGCSKSGKLLLAKEHPALR